uniref:hypothetical protein n=1 Tax=Armatimonas sp. TaxID=1872638 RepID=UPI003752A725
SLILPHLSPLRTLTRVATALAAKKERAGDLAGGLAIRHDLRSLGGRMREQGNLAISKLVGSAITEIAAARHQLVAHRKLWGAGEAVALEQVFARNDAVKTQLGKRTYPSDRFYPLAEQWQVGLQLLSALLATLLLGAFFSLLAKLSQGKPARPGVRFGLWWIIGIVPALIYRAGLSEDETTLRFCLASVLSLIGLFALWQAWRTTKRAQRWQEAGLVLATLLGAAQVILLGIVAMWGGEDTIGAFYDTYLRCFSASEGEAISWWESFWHEAGYRTFFALPTLVPLFALTPILAVISRVKRVPVTFGVARGLGRCALPVALVLTLVYAWQVHETAAQEAQLRADLRECLQNERAFFGEK